MQNITATHVNYYHICHRKLWLFGHNITMEQTSDLVIEGKLIGDNTYPQPSDKYTEVEFDGVKIDFYDTKNRVVHEIKKSSKIEGASLNMLKNLKYYDGRGRNLEPCIELIEKYRESIPSVKVRKKFIDRRKII